MSRVVIVFVALAACGPTREGFAEKRATVACEWLLECAGADTNLDACASVVTEPALDAETCKYDAGAAADCLRQMDERACDAPPDPTAFLCEAAYPDCAEEAVYEYQVIQLGCEYIVECYPESYSTVASCVAAASLGDTTGCSYNPVAARQCLTGLTQMTCTSPPSVPAPDVCEVVHLCP